MAWSGQPNQSADNNNQQQQPSASSFMSASDFQRLQQAPPQQAHPQQAPLSPRKKKYHGSTPIPVDKDDDDDHKMSNTAAMNEDDDYKEEKIEDAYSYKVWTGVPPHYQYWSSFESARDLLPHEEGSSEELHLKTVSDTVTLDQSVFPDQCHLFGDPDQPLYGPADKQIFWQTENIWKILKWTQYLPNIAKMGKADESWKWIAAYVHFIRINTIECDSKVLLIKDKMYKQNGNEASKKWRFPPRDEAKPSKYLEGVGGVRDNYWKGNNYIRQYSLVTVKAGGAVKEIVRNLFVEPSCYNHHVNADTTQKNYGLKGPCAQYRNEELRITAWLAQREAELAVAKCPALLPALYIEALKVKLYIMNIFTAKALHTLFMLIFSDI